MSPDHDLTPVSERTSVRDDSPSSDEDECALFNKLLRPTMSHAIVAPQSPSLDTVVISSEIIARKLDIVYRSTRLLQQAPKNSPPRRIS